MQDLVNWEKEWEEKTIQTSKVSDTIYWNKRAKDYTNYIKTSERIRRYRRGSFLIHLGISKVLGTNFTSCLQGV